MKPTIYINLGSYCPGNHHEAPDDWSAGFNWSSVSDIVLLLSLIFVYLSVCDIRPHSSAFFFPCGIYRYSTQIIIWACLHNYNRYTLSANIVKKTPSTDTGISNADLSMRVLIRKLYRPASNIIVPERYETFVLETFARSFKVRVQCRLQCR